MDHILKGSYVCIASTIILYLALDCTVFSVVLMLYVYAIILGCRTLSLQFLQNCGSSQCDY
jgi:hypothetical protein